MPPDPPIVPPRDPLPDPPQDPPPDPTVEIPRVLRRQDGVISRRQVEECGAGDGDIRRNVRRREWVRLHPGVYVDHTGVPNWNQRAWAALLATWPAALTHDSARRAAHPKERATDDGRPIHVAVDRDRAVRAPAGVVLHRLGAFEDKVMWNRTPPTVRYEDAVLDLAAGATDDFAAIAVLAAAVQGRRTTASRISARLAKRTRISRRPFLAGVLADVAAGTCSALEHAYLVRVERAHQLPAGSRQVRASARGPIYRDVLYEQFGLVVELDGRLHHDSAPQRDADLDRDLDAAVDGLSGVRLGWGQVVSRSCRTAEQVGRLLAQRGWGGVITPCPDCPTAKAEDSVVLQSPGDWDPPLSA